MTEGEEYFCKKERGGMRRREGKKGAVRRRMRQREGVKWERFSSSLAVILFLHFIISPKSFISRAFYN